MKKKFNDSAVVTNLQPVAGSDAALQAEGVTAAQLALEQVKGKKSKKGGKGLSRVMFGYREVTEEREETDADGNKVIVRTVTRIPTDDRREPKNVRRCLLTTKTIDSELRKASKTLALTMNEIVNQALEEFFARHLPK